MCPGRGWGGGAPDCISNDSTDVCAGCIWSSHVDASSARRDSVGRLLYLDTGSSACILRSIDSTRSRQASRIRTWAKSERRLLSRKSAVIGKVVGERTCYPHLQVYVFSQDQGRGATIHLARKLLLSVTRSLKHFDLWLYCTISFNSAVTHHAALTAKLILIDLLREYSVQPLCLYRCLYKQPLPKGDDENSISGIIL